MRLDQPRQRAEQGDRPGDRAGDEQRHPVGSVDRHGLRQHLGEDDDQERHHDGGVEDAFRAEDADEHARGEGGRPDVHDVVADQHRADEALAPGEQPVDQTGPAVAVLLEGQHAGPGRRREGRLGGGEEGGEQQRQDDDRPPRATG